MSIFSWASRLLSPRPPEAPHLVLGRLGEKAAAEFLRRHGHKILYRNFRAPHGGEVDIVCRDKPHNELVFVEVKTRTDEEFGRPFSAVNRKKRRLILRGAMTWLKMLDMPDITFRFDVVEVIMTAPPEIRHLENAFQMPKNYAYQRDVIFLGAAVVRRWSYFSEGAALGRGYFSILP